MPFTSYRRACPPVRPFFDEELSGGAGGQVNYSITASSSTQTLIGCYRIEFNNKRTNDHLPDLIVSSSRMGIPQRRRMIFQKGAER